MPHVFEPLHALELEEFIGDGTECIADQPVTFERVERMFEVLRQDADAMFLQLGRRPLVEVFIGRSARRQLAVDAVETCRDHRGRRQIRIARAIGKTQLNTLARHANHGRAVVIAVADVRWRPGRSGQ